MSRVLVKKELFNTRLATNYGGWMYCTNCDENIGYLCYVTYDKFKFNYTCNCGSHGSALLEFGNITADINSDQNLITIKNRLCCPTDQSPLVTILSKKLVNYEYKIVCNTCGKSFEDKK